MRKSLKFAAYCTAASLMMVAGGTAADAAIITFNVTGVFADGEVLGGSFQENTAYNPGYLNVAITVGTRNIFTRAISGSQNGGIATIEFLNNANEILTLSAPTFNFSNAGGLFNANSMLTAGTQTILLTTGAFVANGAVPEPATWAMMTLGFGAMGFAMRRKQAATRIRFA